MKKLYARFRIMLMTFALGLASFWMADAMKNGLKETPVYLPKVKNDNVFVVFPRYSKEIPFGGGGGSGGRDCCGFNNQTATKAENSRQFKHNRVQ